MFKSIALLLTLISLVQTSDTLGPLKVKTDAGRSAYVGFAVKGKTAVIFLSASAAAPERTEPLPLAFVVDGRRVELPTAQRSKETGQARRDVLQRWTAPLPADKFCEVGSASALSIEAGDLTFTFGPGLDELKALAGRLCD